MTRTLPTRLATVTAAALVGAAALAGPALAAGPAKGPEKAPAKAPASAPAKAPASHEKPAGSHDGVSGTTCTGDTLSASATVSGAMGSRVTARLLGGHDAAHLRDTGLRTQIVLLSARASYPVTFDLAGRTEKMFRVQLVDAFGRALSVSHPVAAASCAPGSEVPEAPAAVLLPLSLLASMGLVAGRKRLAARS